MTISLIGVATGVTNSSGIASSTIIFSAGVPRAADVVYIFGGQSFSSLASAGSVGPTSNSAGYTTLMYSSTLGALGVDFGVWRKVQSPTTDRTVLALAASSHVGGFIGAILRNVSSSSPEDVTTIFTSGASVNPQSPAVTTNTPNAMVWSVIGVSHSTANPTLPSGWTTGGSVSVANSGGTTGNNLTVAGAYIFQATTGTVTPPVWTLATSTTWMAATFVAHNYVPPTSTGLPPAILESLSMTPFIAQ